MREAWEQEQKRRASDERYAEGWVENAQKIGRAWAALDQKKNSKDAEGWPMQHDPVNHPKHYTNHPSGIECIQITEHMGFNLGNAVKYIWRCDLKANEIEDLRKARWYIDREIERRMKKMEGGGS